MDGKCSGRRQQPNNPLLNVEIDEKLREKFCPWCWRNICVWVPTSFSCCTHFAKVIIAKEMTLLQVTSMRSITPSILTEDTVRWRGHVSHFKLSSQRRLDKGPWTATHLCWTPSPQPNINIRCRPAHAREIGSLCLARSPNPTYRNPWLCPKLAVTVLPLLWGWPSVIWRHCPWNTRRQLST